jgi:DNA-directed RNA polymerase subunit RPC12/RpoP
MYKCIDCGHLFAEPIIATEDDGFSWKCCPKCGSAWLKTVQAE